MGLETPDLTAAAPASPLADARAHADRALIDSEARFRLVADALPSIVWFGLPDGRIHYLNRRWYEFTGQSQDEALPDGWLQLLHPDDADRVARDWSAAIASEGTYQVECRYRRHDGQYRWFLARAEPLRDEAGGIIAWFGSASDIHDQKRIEAELTAREAELRDSRDRLQAVLDTAPAAILIATGPDCAEIIGNRRAAELMRMPPGENMSKSVPDAPTGHYRVLAPDGTELPVDRLPVQRAARGEELWAHEEQIAFDDGTVLHLLGNAVPLRDRDGQLRGAVAALIDISERKRAEQQQRLLIAELNHRVKNTLAVVQGIAQQSFRGHQVPAELRHAFEGRLAALSAAHELLTRQSWEAAGLDQVVRGTLAALGVAGERVAIAGDDLLLAPKTAVSFAMAVHELATNAMKYGALSGPEGRVEIAWHVAEGRLIWRWREQGGPPVAPPAHRGFGTRLIERGLAAELKGRAEFRFDPEGLSCTLDAPRP